jgi:hypothetical protein
MSEETINLITVRPDGTFVLRLVEDGPWANPIDDELHRLQERIYNCVDIAIDGHLASKYPESNGKPVVIRLDSYATPYEPVQEFFQAFVEHIANSPEIQRDICLKRFISSLGFEFSWKEKAE